MRSFFGSESTNVTGQWHPEPTFRGTYSILSTCLITMGICVWTAVHLNLPAYGERKWFSPQLIRKILWVLIGLLAPEVTTWVAFEQRREAKLLTKHMRERLRQSGKPPCLKRKFWVPSLVRLLWEEKQSKFDRHEWTMTHSHYVRMGGFAIDVKSHNLQFLNHRKFERFTLSTDGFIWVADHALETIPNLSEAQILDKSKANGLAKFLVCVQASWFCIQCMIRLSQGYSISFLELNTFAHALCALLCYIFWWDKPLDIGEATIIQSKEISAFLLVEAMSFDDSAKKFRDSVDRIRLLDLDLKATSKKKVSQPVSCYAYDLHNLPDPLPDSVALSKNDYIHGHKVSKAKVRTISRFRGRLHRSSEPIYLTRPELICLRVALEEKKRLADSGSFYRPNYHPLTIRNPERPGGSSLKASIVTSAGISFVFAGLCFGGIHLTAFNAIFPSPLQKLLWRISSVTLTSSAPIIILGLLPYREGGIEDRLVAKDKFHGIDYFYNAIWAGCTYMVFGISVFYVFCRAFLLIECFISIPHLPDSAFKVPSSAQYFPHIS